MPIKINWVINLIIALIFLLLMLNKSSNNHNKNTFSETSNIAEEKIICKDGFCSLPNQKKISKQDLNNIDLFDPIQ